MLWSPIKDLKILVKLDLEIAQKYNTNELLPIYKIFYNF